MFMCNPLGDINFPLDGTPCTSADLGVGVPLKHDCLVGRGMLFKNGSGTGQGNTSDYCQGEFGLFDCPDGIVPNTLVTTDWGRPNCGAVFHDSAVWMRPA